MSVVDLRADDGGELVEDLARNPTDVDGAEVETTPKLRIFL
ncbi:hypothetical protein QP888_10025 [Corynebacterium sp. MSK297]|nr:hypothetical protein [Corynebacterium sp. MSK297]MDK8846820.1 hypothetical protein [Corynebacterium sp. MSK297]